MKASQIKLFVLIVIAIPLLMACNQSLVVKHVNYAQQIESVLIPNDDGIVTDVRYGISYSIMPFQYEELKDTTSILIKEVHMIRNNLGFYFITADQFKHVYVMYPREGALKLEKKILVEEEGLYSPAFNWRDPAIQLINDSSKTVILLNEKGIYKDEVAS